MAADGVTELRERPEPSLCRGRTTSQLPLNPQCVTIVSQASRAFTETTDMAGGGTGEKGLKDTAGETHAMLCTHPIPSRPVARLPSMATERTLSTCRMQEGGKLTEHMQPLNRNSDARLVKMCVAG